MTDTGFPSSAGGGNTDQDAAAAPELSQEELDQRTDIARKRSAAFGTITALLAKTPPYQDYKIADLAWIAGPAVTTGQFAIAEAHERTSGAVIPIGVVMWALVSEAVDTKLAANQDAVLKLDLSEWRSGEIPWVIATVGERRVVGKLLSNLMTSAFDGHEPRIRARGKDGNLMTGRLRIKDGEAEAAPDAG